MEWPVGILLISLGVLLYISYDRGYLPVKSMSAIHFIGNMGAGTNKVRLLALQLGRSEECCDSKRVSLTNLLSKERSAKAQYRPMCWEATRSLN